MSNDLIPVPTFNPEAVNVLLKLELVLNGEVVEETFNPFLAVDVNHRFVFPVKKLNKAVFNNILSYRSFTSLQDFSLLNRIISGYKNMDRFIKYGGVEYNITAGQLVDYVVVDKLKKSLLQRMKKILKRARVPSPFYLPVRQRSKYFLLSKRFNAISRLLRRFGRDKNTPMLLDKFDIRVIYVEIQPAIISFISQANEEFTVGVVDDDCRTERVIFLQSLFDIGGNCKTFDEWLDKKTEQLLSLDLDYLCDKKGVTK